MCRRRVARWFAAGLVGTFCSLSAWSQPYLLRAASGNVNKGLERRQVAQSEREWKQALLARDASQLGGLLSDSYVGIGPDGTIFNKTEEVDASVSGANSLSQIHVEERKIRIYGTTAVVTSRVEVEGTFGGKPLHGQYRYTRVWALDHGQWRVVSFEANRVDNPAGDRAND